ncbi:hypothetical protein [Pseudomonas citronellolis]|uniref:hypothetical protein n=1 Tax=Pseudomonas citronellolis TaxID=53408 RepID=UPI0023E353CD|nr:hypothetical protein [Pseudomonas citronellolis]MDF3935332.1 hypothetical protein [Pseudomonas citronellolis]
MSGQISISVEVDEDQAASYLAWLFSQYETAMAGFWFDDRYRYTPQGFRAKRIVADHPHMVGLVRTMRALRLQLGAKA